MLSKTSRSAFYTGSALIAIGCLLGTATATNELWRLGLVLGVYDALLTCSLLSVSATATVFLVVFKLIGSAEAPINNVTSSNNSTPSLFTSSSHIVQNLEKTGNSMNIYANELAALNQFFNHYTLGFRVTKPQQQVVLTPYSVVYNLTKAKGVSNRSLKTHLSDLAGWLHGKRTSAGYPAKVQITMVEQPLSIVLPRVDPKPLMWESRSWERKQWHTLLGRYYIADNGHPLTIDLEHPQQFSILVGGQSGCGKSTLMDGLILNACEVAEPRRLKIMFIDIEGKHFEPFRAVPHCAGFVKTLGGAMTMLKEIEVNMSGPENKYQHRTLLVIDEIQRLTRAEDVRQVTEFKRLLANIASMGRAYGYSILIGTQKPMASVVPTLIRDNCVVRIAGMCKSKSQSSVILGEGEDDASNLSTIGSFIFSDGSTKQMFYSYRIADLAREIGAVASMYHGQDAQFIDYDSIAVEEQFHPLPQGYDLQTVFTDLQPTPSSVLQPSATVPVIIPEPVLQVFAAYDANDGTLANGWQTNAIEAYAAYIGKSSGGKNYAKFKEVVFQLRDMYLRTYLPNEAPVAEQKVIKIANYR
ncbi:MAG: FtsK/SpoIIIE domain-containing protein [Chloroflexota bacterium]